MDKYGFSKTMALLKPTWRKTPPKPGTMLKLHDVVAPGMDTYYERGWHELTPNHLIVGKTLAFVRSLDLRKDRPTKVRFPEGQKKLDKVWKWLKRYQGKSK